MILVVPHLETLVVALKAGLIPPETAAKPAIVSQLDDRIAIESKVKLTKKAKAELNAIGITESERHLGETRTHSTWLQIVPVRSVASIPPFTAQTPILFDIRDPSKLGNMVREMIRLGNDRQSFRWLEHADGRSSVLLRVVNPPYYSLLRAIDRLDGDTITAYREEVPGVWVPLGAEHPLADAIRPPSGQLIIIPVTGEWSVLPEAPFRDIYELLSISLPGKTVAWSEATLDRTVTVALRLVPAASKEAAEWWVFSERGFREIDAFVRDADERLIRQLRFAVGRSTDGQETIILRTAISKEAPPAIDWPSAIAYAPYWKLPNLLLPVGTALHPPLRRETVRATFADDPTQNVWLDPDNQGGFTPRSLAESAFRPLEDWVEYVIERNREPVAEWISATGFDWDSFRVGTLTPPSEKPPKPSPGGRKKGPKSPESTEPTPPDPQVAARPIVEPIPFVPPKKEETPEPSEWKAKRAELERKFLELNADSLDDPGRQELWVPLAVCYAGTGEFNNLATAIAQAIDHSPERIAEFGAIWANAEWGTANLDSARLKQTLSDEPTAVDLRRRASLLLAFARESATKSLRLTAYDDLLRFEHRLPVRIAWILLREAARDRGGDDLALTRGRDRIFARLYSTGLNPERDLVSFLRYAGLQQSEVGRVIREKADVLAESVRAWTEQGLASAKPDYDRRNTLALIDLSFSWAFARLQETEASKRLESLADARLRQPDDRTNASSLASFQSLGMSWIRDAYGARIAQARNAEADRMPLPMPLQDRFRLLAPPSTPERATLSQADHFGLARLRTESSILEPVERIEPYDSVLQYDTELKTALVRLGSSTDPEMLARETERLIKPRRTDPSRREELFRILHRTIPLAPRVGEGFAAELMALVPQSLPTEPLTIDRAERIGELFDRAIRIAAYFSRAATVQTLLADFTKVVQKAAMPELRARLIDSFGITPLLSVRSAALILPFLESVQTALFQGLPLERAVVIFAGKAPSVWVDFLKATMVIAVGWESASQLDRSGQLLTLVERELSAPSTKIESLSFAKLMGLYIRACGVSRPDVGLSRVETLIRSVPPARLANAYSTNTLYSRLHLLVAEAVCLAVSSDLSVSSLSGRRWKDEEEYLVRQRITADVRMLTG
jgi:hypothetical protein